MSPDLTERALENAIKRALLAGGPDDPAAAGAGGGSGASDRPGSASPALTAVREPSGEYLASPSGGYHLRTSGDYDPELCLIPADVIDFIYATQPQAWDRLKEHHGAGVKEKFLARLSSEIGKRGTLAVLRDGVKDRGVRIELAYFQPASALNQELARTYRANIFSIVRQLKYRSGDEGEPRPGQSLDMAIFLNGVPLFTAELKNLFTGQDVQDAMRQYKRDRDPRDGLLAYGRCLAHFAVDPFLVYMTTKLDKGKTRFLPFNIGRDGGAGNPPVPPTRTGYATAYLWEETWARDSVLDLVRRFIHEVTPLDDRGRKNGTPFTIFPRYHQLDAVRRLVTHSREHGSGNRYLIQHSAGSGKSFTIAWLAHQLSTLHDHTDQRVFDSIIVITDRRILDRQLQHTVRQFEQTLGVVENIDQTSRQLKAALEGGKTIIVTTLQKFPVISAEIGALPGKRFAVIVDEAHSSQSGESSKHMRSIFAQPSLEAAENAEAGSLGPEDQLESRLLAEIEARGRLPNLSTFAFTATPKQKTLELFGEKQPNGRFKPFSLYSMRQAMEESFILDVLENYTTYTAYWRLLKTIEDDPRYDRGKATRLLKRFVELSPHAIDRKVEIIVEHFATQVQERIAGQAKAMIVTRSRLHALRYMLAMQRHIEASQHNFGVLVAFSDSVEDGGRTYTESGMNGFSETQTAANFDTPEYRFLIVANKFQTGFDQPLLHTMYVDKQLGGVGAVQTLSRLNRTHPDKRETMVLDFANEADAIQKAFEPYYEATILSEGTDPNLLYDIQNTLMEYAIYTEAEVSAFAALYFEPGTTQDQVYAALEPQKARFDEMAEEEQSEFRSYVRDYVRQYAFLSQVIGFPDPDLEALYLFLRHLRRLIKGEGHELPIDVQRNIDMESYRLQQTSEGSIELPRGSDPLDPKRVGQRGGLIDDELEPLSAIIAELNDRFGINLGPEHKVTLGRMLARLEDDPALQASARASSRENVRLTFKHKAEDVAQDIGDTNFDLYKRITDDESFGRAFMDLLFDQYMSGHRDADRLRRQPESQTLEFKSSLRWDLKKDEKDDSFITHACLKTIAAFLNTEGGDLLIGVADNGEVVGIEHDRFENEDKFMLHLIQVVRNGLGDRAGTCVDPRTQVVDGKVVCLVSCRRSPEGVFLTWKGLEKELGGDFYVRSGPRSDRLEGGSVEAYLLTRFGHRSGED